MPDPAAAANSARQRYYILFRTHEQAMALHDLLDRCGIRNRIAPAPRAIQGELSCGVSLLIEEDEIEEARRCIDAHGGEYFAIRALAGQLQAKRDRYC